MEDQFKSGTEIRQDIVRIAPMGRISKSPPAGPRHVRSVAWIAAVPEYVRALASAPPISHWDVRANSANRRMK